MEELWTPWRMPYIAGPKDEGCVLCDVQDPEASERLLLARGRTGFVVMNLYPYVTGHLMVVPYRHAGRLRELGDEEIRELADLAALSDRILRETLGAERIHHGMNLGRPAGAGVAGHVHLHLVPRTARPPRAPGTRTSPAGSPGPPVPLEETRARLAPRFKLVAGEREET